MSDRSRLLSGMVRYGRLAALTALTMTSVLAPGHVLARGQRASSAGSVSVFVQPGAHATPVLNLIRSAQHSIRLEVYLLTNRTIIGALGAARRHGIDVRVLLEQHPYGGGRYAGLGYSALQAAGVPVRWANERAFTYTHEKSMEIDGRVAGIFTFNLTSSGIFSNREFGVIDNDAADARALATIFDADWSRRAPRYTDPRLVVSPYDSRRDLDSIIDGARHTLDIYAEEVDDSGMEAHLAGAVRRRVRVRLITSATSTGVDTLRRDGVHVGIMATPYVHAKAIVADGHVVFIGSENLSTTSLDANREVGVLLDSAPAATIVERTFASDWSGSSGGSGKSGGTSPPPVSSGSLHVAVTTSPRTISRHQELRITAHTSPGATCSVRVTYPDGYVSRSRALAQSWKAGSSGTVYWSWRVGSTVTGTASARVTCTLGGRSASATATFEIR